MSQQLGEIESNVDKPIEGVPRVPGSLQLRSYQEEAVTNWFKNQGRGTFKMATGSGKTIAALALVTELYSQIGLQGVLIICPYRHLVTQWARECQEFGINPLLAFETVHSWQPQLSAYLYQIHTGTLSFFTVITTNATLISERLQSQLRYFPAKTLIIGDEAHNLGTPRLEQSLPRHLGLRLGLSATPERHFDEAGTDAIFDYFGPVLAPELALADAIRLGALVRYRYYPILVELTNTESRAYRRLTTRIGWALMNQEKLDFNDTVTSLLVRRSRIIASAANKLEALRQLMSKRLQTNRTLFYCGDGAVETLNIYQRQMVAVTQLLGKELGYRVNTYTADTPIEEREQLRRQFETGELQGLVAIRCLDEGIDIPAIQTAVILASSRNPRQFIQRRGRILRPHPDKERATLFDMIVLPPDLGRETLEVERNLLKKELKRFLEFADLADNAGEARVQLLDLQKRYGLLDL